MRLLNRPLLRNSYVNFTVKGVPKSPHTFLSCFRSFSNVDSISTKHTYVPIADFYAGKSVFITGGTGYLGKLIIEKLLYSCEDVDSIYVLLRSKNGVDAEKRLVDIIEEPVFSRLRKQKPHVFDKIRPVFGELTTDPYFGMACKDLKEIIKKASVVFHSAATVRFDEPLSVALKVNLDSTRKILELSKNMRNIQSFVYISTAYSQIDKKIINEIVYPPPVAINDVYEYQKKHGDDEKMVQELLRKHKRPNTYTLTKALAENYVSENRQDIPAVIVRPSIVTPTKNEPIKNWLDNSFGATTLLKDIGQGYIRVLYGNGDGILDLIPADYVANFCIVAAARADKSKLQVFNACSSHCNPILLKQLTHPFAEEFKKLNLHHLPYPGHIYTDSRLVLKIITLLQKTAAYAADITLKFKGEKPRFLKKTNKAAHLRDSTEYFTSRFWVWFNNDARTMISSLSRSDKESFPCDPTDINWEEYVKNYCIGIKEYIIGNHERKNKK